MSRHTRAAPTAPRRVGTTATYLFGGARCVLPAPMDDRRRKQRLIQSLANSPSDCKPMACLRRSNNTHALYHQDSGTDECSCFSTSCSRSPPQGLGVSLNDTRNALI